jgi:cytochrome c oxidase subunit III
MPASNVLEDFDVIIGAGYGGGSTDTPAGGGDDDSGHGGGHGRPSPRRYFTGVGLALVAILMFFMSFVSAYIVRKGLGGDWLSLLVPRILWANTAILLASSLTIELARRLLARGNLAAFRSWWNVTTALGVVFLAGQFIAWRQLVAAGAYLAGNPSNSFFYTLTAAHGAHLVGGIAALIYVAFRNFSVAQVTRETAAELVSIYWHFLDGLWLFLFLLLTLGR